MLGLVNYEAVQERVWWCLNMFDDVWSMFLHDFQTRHLNISSWRTESEWIRMADADDSNAIYWSGLGRWCPRGLDDLDGTTLFVDICWVARHLHRSQTLSKQWFWNILSKQTACACGLWRSLCQVPRWFESNFQQSTQALSDSTWFDKAQAATNGSHEKAAATVVATCLQRLKMDKMAHEPTFVLNVGPLDHSR